MTSFLVTGCAVFIGRDKLPESAREYRKSPYGEHLKAVAEGKVRYE